jgi:hypothetical protein
MHEKLRFARANVLSDVILEKRHYYTTSIKSWLSQVIKYPL